jgi:AcrR family transcriptional regulator
MEKEEIKKRILDQFLLDFNAKGPAFKVGDLAKAIHISKKTFYVYFPNKSALYEEVIAQAMAQIAERKKAILAGEGTTKQKLYDLLTIHTPFEAVVNIGKLSVLQKEEPLVYQRLLASYEASWGDFLSLVEIGKKDGTLREDADGNFLVDILIHTYQSFYHDDFLLRNHLSYSEAVDKLASTVLAGVEAR